MLNNFYKLMTEQLTASLFDESTEMYREGNYPVCLALLNDCIILQPEHSILYSNRAISNFGLKEVEESLLDLQRSVRINHLSYIAYFNAFSINFQLQRQEPAFKNLCFCISSAYTVLARRLKNIDWINQSLYYSYNNKESIFLKAMHKLQENQHAEALNLLVEAHSLQIQPQNKSNLEAMLSHIQNIHGIEHNIPLTHSSSADNGFQLKTNLEYPVNLQQFQQKIEEMVKEFNSLNKLLNKLQSQKTIQTNTPTEKSIQNSQKMQKETNCITIYESNLEQQSSMKNEDEQSQPQSKQDRLDKLNLYSTISQANQQDNSLQSKVSSYDLYPLLKEVQTVSIFFQQVLFIEAEKMSKYKNIYAIFHYSSGQGENKIIRTGNSKLKESLCRWCQWSDQIKLNKSVEKVAFTIYNTSFTQFEDKELGSGQFELNQAGYINIPFASNRNEYGGQLHIIVQKND